MKSNDDANSDALTRVAVFQSGGEWIVEIIENGQEVSRKFDEEAFARSFADGQRLRLKLPLETR